MMRDIGRVEATLSHWTKWNGECLEWTRGKLYGYGVFNALGQYKAHRVAWVMKRGPIPEGALVLHRCNNRACVNVDHLYLGDHKDNARDAVAAGTATWLWCKRTACQKGHEYVPGSFSVRASSEGIKYRHCLICERPKGRLKQKLRRERRKSLEGERKL